MTCLSEREREREREAILLVLPSDAWVSLVAFPAWEDESLGTLAASCKHITSSADALTVNSCPLQGSHCNRTTRRKCRWEYVIVVKLSIAIGCLKTTRLCLKPILRRKLQTSRYYLRHLGQHYPFHILAKFAPPCTQIISWWLRSYQLQEALMLPAYRD